METFWVITILTVGTIHPATMPPAALEAGFATGTVENRSQLYFETEEGCVEMRESLMVTAPTAMANSGLLSGRLDISVCKTVELQVVNSSNTEENISEDAAEVPPQE